MSTMTAYVDPDLGDCLGTDVSILDYYGDTYGHLETDWKEWNYRGVDILIPKTCTIREDGSGGYVFNTIHNIQAQAHRSKISLP